MADFPRSLLARDSLDFSFSGIKTAVLYHVHGVGKTSGGLERMTAQDVSNVAASFQEAVVDVLVEKVRRAVRATATMSNRLDRPITSFIQAPPRFSAGRE